MEGGNSAYRQTGTLTYGHSGSDVLHIHDPTACYTMEVTAGTYEYEVSWSIKGYDGEALLSGGAPYSNQYCGDGTTPPPSSSPTAEPTDVDDMCMAETISSCCTDSDTEPEGCTDDMYWHGYSKGWKNCYWVAENTGSRCSVTSSTDGRTAYEGCPVTCDTCPTPTQAPTTSPPTSDSTLAPTTMFGMCSSLTCDDHGLDPTDGVCGARYLGTDTCSGKMNIQEAADFCEVVSNHMAAFFARHSCTAPACFVSVSVMVYVHSFIHCRRMGVWRDICANV